MTHKIALKMLRQVLSVLAVLTLNIAVNAQKDTLYFSDKWKPTVKDSAAFFRPPVSSEGALFRVQDYFISGELQMNGLSKNADKDLWQGKVTWYNEDGSIFQEGTYVDNRLEGDFITYLGEERLVSTYVNGRFMTGKRNGRYGRGQMYFEQENDTLHEILYDTAITGIREEHYGTKDSYRLYSKYYAEQGALIGERRLLPNNYYKGVEVFYFMNPMRVKEIRYYPYGQMLISATYYANGQIREEVTQEPEWSKTYYSPEGKELGKIAYRIERDVLRPQDGTELFFTYEKSDDKSSIVASARTYEEGRIMREELRHENGQIRSVTSYKNGAKELQISYDANGKEIARMVYKAYRPFEGTEMQAGRTATYKEGELVEEIIYYLNTQVPQVKKTKTLETYFDKSGTVLGTLELESENGYSKPKKGKRYSVDYREGHITSIEEYNDGVQVRRTRFRKRKVGKSTSKNFKRIEEFGADGYKKTKETKFYSNGSKQSEITFQEYKEIEGKFYDSDEQLIGSYDFEKKDGTRYVFFGDSDQIEVIEELKEGEMQRLKRYSYGKSAEYGQIHPVLLQDINIDCCATYYTLEGEVIAKLIFKNQRPWEGDAYDYSARTKYAIKDGKRNGTYQKLDYYQKVLEEGQFVDDKEEGRFAYYDYQGHLLRTENFKAGKLAGKALYYDKKAAILSELEYKEGVPVNGTKIIGIYNGKEPSTETYVDGKLVERVSFEKDGKQVSQFKEGGISETIAYHKGSENKKLRYSTTNGTLDGTVIRFDKMGKEQHRAKVKSGKLESGTLYILPRYQDEKLLYIQVYKDEDSLSVKYIGLEGQVLLNAEETILPGASLNYLVKLDVDITYLSERSLY